MTISLKNIGKRYNYDWIFRHVDFEFSAGNSCVILGPNGSGKSTLLQIIAGSLTHNEGTVLYRQGEQPVTPELLHRQLALAAPYTELVEELTLEELFSFQQQFKPFLPYLKIDEMMQAVQLGKAARKQIRYFSSGMKQRAKLALALFADVPLLLLDEPCANLDNEGILIYQQLMEQYRRNRIVIVCSNDEQEYHFCNQRLHIQDFK